MEILTCIVFDCQETFAINYFKTKVEHKELIYFSWIVWFARIMYKKVVNSFASSITILSTIESSKNYRVATRCHHEYNVFMSSNRRTAAESLAFLMLGIGSPTHSSVQPLSVVFTRTANVNCFACAGPPSFTSLKLQVSNSQLAIYHMIDLYASSIWKMYPKKKNPFIVSLPIEWHGPISMKADFIQHLSRKCLAPILLFLPIFIVVLLSFSHFLLFESSKRISCG